MWSIKERRKIILSRRTVILFAMDIMILSLIFNGNRFGAGLSFVMLPFLLAFGIIFLYTFRTHKGLKQYLINVLICLSAVYSTSISPVVSWGVTGYSLIIFNLFYIMVTHVNFDEAMIKHMIKFYSIAVLLISALMFISYCAGYNVVNGRISIRFMGVRKDENYLSAFLVFGYLYFLYKFLFGKEKRLFLISAAALIFVAIYLTGSRAAFISLALSSFLLISRLILAEGISVKGLAVVALLLVVGILGFQYLQTTSLFDRMMDADSYSDNIRLRIWGYAMQAFLNNPVWGSGVASGTYYAQLYLRWYTHSCFIDIITGQGIIGAILYIGLFIQLLKVKRTNIVFMAALIISFFCPMFFINGYETATFWIPMAIAKIISDYCKYNDIQRIME